MDTLKIVTSKQVVISILVTSVSALSLLILDWVDSAIVSLLVGAQVVLVLRSLIGIRHLVAGEIEAASRREMSRPATPGLEDVLVRIRALENTATLNKRSAARIERTLANVEAAATSVADLGGSPIDNGDERLVASLVQLSELQALGLRLLSEGSSDMRSELQRAQVAQWNEDFREESSGVAIEIASSEQDVERAGTLVAVVNHTEAARAVALSGFWLLAESPIPCGISLYARPEALADGMSA